MKRILLLILAVMLGIGLILVGCVAPPAEQEEEEEEEEEERQEIALTFVTFWPSGDFQAAIGHQAYMDTIAERVLEETDDYEIKWTAYYAGTVPTAEIYSNVRDGAYDIGATGPGYSPGVFPLCEMMNLPGPVNRLNAYTMSLAKQDLYEWSPALRAEFAAQNLHLSFFWSVGPGFFLMTPGNQVRELADFEGKVIRAATLGSVCAISKLGGEGLRCPMDEAKEKFQAGLMHGILCPTDTPKGFGLGEFVREMTYAPCTYDFVFMQVMNKAKYDSLPAEVKAIFDDVDSKWTDYYGKLRYWGEYQAGLVEYCRALPGWKEYWLPTEDPDEYAGWAEATYACVEEWIAGDAAKQALWNKYVELNEYYATTAPYKNWTPGTAAPTPP